MFEKALPLEIRDESHVVSETEHAARLSTVPPMTLTVEETADELHVSRPVAYELVKEPAFPSFRIGKRILVNRLGLQRWIDERSSLPLTDPTDSAA